jgi:transcriptional regulator with XRE-family HTH domain
MVRRPMTNPPGIDDALAGLRRRLVQTREEAGLTQAELADKIGPHAVTLSRIETGRQAVSVAALMDIAAALRTPVAALMEPEPDSAVLDRLGRAVATRRSEVGVGQEELAERLCVPVGTVARIESGRFPMPVEMLFKLAKEIDTSAAALLSSAELG